MPGVADNLRERLFCQSLPDYFQNMEGQRVCCPTDSRLSIIFMTFARSISSGVGRPERCPPSISNQPFFNKATGHLVFLQIFSLAIAIFSPPNK